MGWLIEDSIIKDEIRVIITVRLVEDRYCKVDMTPF